MKKTLIYFKHICILILAVSLLFLFLSFSCILKCYNNHDVFAFTSVNDNNEQLILSEKYDGREHGVNKNIHDQGSTNLCWAYSAIHAAEANISLKGLSSNVSLSPNQIGYNRYEKYSDPLKNNGPVNEDMSASGSWQNQSGSGDIAVNLMSMWCGPVVFGAPYTNGYGNCAYLMDEAIEIESANMNKDNDIRLAIKKAIVEYGAVTFSFNYIADTQYLNPTTATGSYPHACAIIGWDDSIDKNSFKPRSATQNGGWLVKNSYSSNSYFYLTYDCSVKSVYALSMCGNDKYANNYFYDNYAADFFAAASYKTKQACNVYKVVGEAEVGKVEVLKAVNVAVVGENITCKVNVYTDVLDRSKPIEGKLSATKTQKFNHGGYRLITLDSPVKLQKGTNFTIEVIILESNSDDTYIKMSQHTPSSNIEARSYRMVGESYQYCNNGLSSMRIKAFTSFENADIKFVPEINWNKDGNLYATYGSSLTGKNISTNSNGEIRYSSSNLDVASVDEYSGALTIKKVGSTTITARVEETDDYLGGSAFYTVTINKKPLYILELFAVDRTYNGDTNVLLNGGLLSGVINNDDVNCIIPKSGYMQNANAGITKKVMVNLPSLYGQDIENYILQTPDYITVDINKAMPNLGKVYYYGGDIYLNTNIEMLSSNIKYTNTSIGGTITLKETQFTAGQNEYSWIFTPYDTVNFEIVSGNIEINVLPYNAPNINNSNQPLYIVGLVVTSIIIITITTTALIVIKRRRKI